VIPYSFELLPQNKALLSVNGRWREILEEHAIPFADLTPLMSDKSVLKYYALGDYIHLNSLGHGLIVQQAVSLLNRHRVK